MITRSHIDLHIADNMTKALLSRTLKCPTLINVTLIWFYQHVCFQAKVIFWSADKFIQRKVRSNKHPQMDKKYFNSLVYFRVTIYIYFSDLG